MTSSNGHGRQRYPEPSTYDGPFADHRYEAAQVGLPMGWRTKESFFNIILLRMALLFLVYGHCEATGGFAFAGYGIVLATIPGNETDAFRFFQLALKVPARKRSIPATSVILYNITVGLEASLAAYRTGLGTSTRAHTQVLL